jgi:hypothetical protein
LNQDFAQASIDEQRANIAWNRLENIDRVVESALISVVNTHAKSRHCVVRIDLERPADTLLRFVQQSDMRIDHR